MYCGKCGRWIDHGKLCDDCMGTYHNLRVPYKEKNVFPALCVATIAIFHLLIPLIVRYYYTSIYPMINEKAMQEYVEMRNYGYEYPSVWWTISFACILLGAAIILIRRKNLKWVVAFLVIVMIIGLANIISSIGEIQNYFEDLVKEQSDLSEAEYEVVINFTMPFMIVYMLPLFLFYRLSFAPMILISCAVIFVRERKVFSALVITAGIIGIVTSSPIYLFMGLSLRKDFYILQEERRKSAIKSKRWK